MAAPRPPAVLAFGASLAIALPYAELACRLPVAGGGYAFARMVLGPRWGFLMGWGYWGAYLFLSGYVTLGFGGYLSAGTGLPASVGAVGLIGQRPEWFCPWPSRPVRSCWWPAAARGSRSAAPGCWPA